MNSVSLCATLLPEKLRDTRKSATSFIEEGNRVGGKPLLRMRVPGKRGQKPVLHEVKRRFSVTFSCHLTKVGTNLLLITR